jgi:bacillithiol biosynthesis cysteine-adding enzyme BshC
MGCPGRLDSFPTALREYGTVSADSAASVPASDQVGHVRAQAVDVRRFPWIRPLVGDYAFDFARVASQYSGNPGEAQAWRDAVVRTQRHPRDRSAIAAILAAQQNDRNAPPEARAAAAQLADATSVAVVTGQQAGAFGGPLFTLLKALTALRLARETANRQRVPAVAIFWVDAEDHDWEEVRSCTVLDAEFQPRTVTLPNIDGAGELPIAGLELDARVERTIQELADALPQTEFTSSVLADLKAAWRPGVGMARAFAIWIERLLGPHGLVVYESNDPATKPLVADVFARELASPGRTSQLATEAGSALAAAGHAPQVVPQADSVSLFRLEGGRHSIRRQDDGYVIGDQTYSVDDLSAQASANAAGFSPNVLLRPLVQDTIFPTVCYVAGPSELAYHGQLRGVYQAFGVPQPLIYPRASATLLDSGAARFLSKYNVAIEDLQPQDESALNRLLQSQLPAAIEQSLREARTQVEQSMARVAAALPSLDPTLAGAAKTTQGKMEHELHSLHNKIIHAAKRRDETLRRQFTRAQAQAFPQGHPQERTLGVVYFLTKYGPGLVDRLLEDLPLSLGEHWILIV